MPKHVVGSLHGRLVERTVILCGPGEDPVEEVSPVLKVLGEPGMLHLPPSHDFEVRFHHHYLPLAADAPASSTKVTARPKSCGLRKFGNRNAIAAKNPNHDEKVNFFGNQNFGTESEKCIKRRPVF